MVIRDRREQQNVHSSFVKGQIFLLHLDKIWNFPNIIYYLNLSSGTRGGMCGRTDGQTDVEVRGSFQKFCTLYVFSLKMNLFYKIHLQTFNVTSIVLYHSDPTYGQSLVFLSGRLRC
jgi:hypothetical protein